MVNDSVDWDTGVEVSGSAINNEAPGSLGIVVEQMNGQNAEAQLFGGRKCKKKTQQNRPFPIFFCNCKAVFTHFNITFNMILMQFGGNL